MRHRQTQTLKKRPVCVCVSAVSTHLSALRVSEPGRWQCRDEKAFHALSLKTTCESWRVRSDKELPSSLQSGTIFLFRPVDRTSKPPQRVSEKGTVSCGDLDLIHAQMPLCRDEIVCVKQSQTSHLKMYFFPMKWDWNKFIFSAGGIIIKGGGGGVSVLAVS